ncbi:MAG: hypothetical protein DI587_09260 [Variovorax paradoxus]|nr:MAG: hypothetical protein DI583_09260 [Variovorax paradoxus]PZQ12185.1 MAG: hypothetical protein DI587_09260 [Variovorax paradoxus]
MVVKTKQFSGVPAMLAGRWRHAGPVLLCAALGGAPVPAHAQADPACYVVNRLLLWLKPRSLAIDCAPARAIPAPNESLAASAAREPAPAAPDPATPTTRRRP